MSTWMQSHFLQALGWATLNSIWQMALLWAIYSGLTYFVCLSSTQKYRASVGAVFLGFTWFIITFVFYYQDTSTSYAIFDYTITHSNSLLNVCLLAASITYLLLLFFPAIRLFNNWKLVKKIQLEGQQKAELEYRLFVQKISFLLRIKRKVKVVMSAMVNSPVTVGYLKPVILLPIAALNQLSTVQVEAILLHELSHIRRYDYLVNLVLSIIHTLLYFNPFVKSFISAIEAERETCCDELVLQFGYDKVGYASALLHLEKSSGRHSALTLAAASKKNLLNRIEKIVGMEKKSPFKLVQVVPLFLAMFSVVLFNSVLIIKDTKNGEAISYTNDSMVFNPWHLDNGISAAQPKVVPSFDYQNVAKKADIRNKSQYDGVEIEIFNISEPPLVPQPPSFIENILPVSFDEVESGLSKEEKQKVKTTVEATKKIASTLQWNEIEANMGEVMNEQEKAIAKREYLHELDKVAWSAIEQNMKVNFDKLNWAAIEANVEQALSEVHIDSLHTVYEQALAELEKTESSFKSSKPKCAFIAMPDASLREIQIAKETLRKNIAELKTIRCPKQVIKL